jgi:hypothetical protein
MGWCRFAVAMLAVAVVTTAPAIAQDVVLPAPLPSFRQLDTPPVVPPLTPGPADPAATGPATAPLAATEAIAASVDPQPVRLKALASDGGAPIGQGLVWRVFNAKPNSAGQLVLAAKSQDAAPTLQLAPGDYVVHVAYGHAQASDALSVHQGANDKALVLEVGGLRLNAAIAGDVGIPRNMLHFDTTLPAIPTPTGRWLPRISMQTRSSP